MINNLAKEVIEINKKNGFYEEERNLGEMIALIHSEASEALEADRTGKIFSVDESEMTANEILELSDDSDFKKVFLGKIKDSFEDELADTVIRILDLAAYKDIDLEAHIKAKMRYNSMRPYKHGKRY